MESFQPKELHENPYMSTLSHASEVWIPPDCELGCPNVAPPPGYVRPLVLSGMPSFTGQQDFLLEGRKKLKSEAPVTVQATLQPTSSNSE